MCSLFIRVVTSQSLNLIFKAHKRVSVERGVAVTHVKCLLRILFQLLSVVLLKREAKQVHELERSFFIKEPQCGYITRLIVKYPQHGYRE